MYVPGKSPAYIMKQCAGKPVNVSYYRTSPYSPRSLEYITKKVQPPLRKHSLTRLFSRYTRAREFVQLPLNKCRCRLDLASCPEKHQNKAKLLVTELEPTAHLKNN